MKKIAIVLMLGLLFIGCSSKGQETLNIEPKLVIGKTLGTLSLNDQFEKKQAIKASTKKVVFAFSKDVAHTCNDFFVTKEASYLSDNNTQFVADVSAAPSIIRSMFIMPGLKDFEHTVMILDDENIAAPYRSGLNVESIIIVHLNDGKIVKITNHNSQKELQEVIEAK